MGRCTDIPRPKRVWHRWEKHRCLDCGAVDHRRKYHTRWERWDGGSYRWSTQPCRERTEHEKEVCRQRALIWHAEHPLDITQASPSTLRLRALQHFGLPLTGWPRKPKPITEWRKGGIILRQVKRLLKERTNRQSSLDALAVVE